jgi:hypothetical protein
MSYVSLFFECAACGRHAVANPNLVLSIPSRWDAEQRHFVPDPNGHKEPICRACAVRALERIRTGDPTLLSYSPMLREPDYLERAYDLPAEELD